MGIALYEHLAKIPTKHHLFRSVTMNKLSLTVHPMSDSSIQSTRTDVKGFFCEFVRMKSFSVMSSVLKLSE